MLSRENPLHEIATKLLSKAMVNGVQGGRTGEAGPIGVCPFVEIGDDRVEVTEQYQYEAQGEDLLTAHYWIIYYTPYTNQPEVEKELLRRLAWDCRSAIKSDWTLGEKVLSATVHSLKSDLIKRNERLYWYFALQVQVRFFY